MKKSITRILVADDHDIVRKSIAALITSQPDMEVVATAENGCQAVNLAQEVRPDVIVMDITMPELDGIRAAGKIRELNIPALIIILSMNFNTTLVEQARKNGAIAYIQKPEASRKLLPAIRAASSGDLSL